MNLQPVLKNDTVTLLPLKVDDFEKLYAVACDPLIWEQHPNPDRYQRDVFDIFFKGAMESKGAFIIFDSETKLPIGSSRYYDYDQEKKQVLIGYTFFVRDHWGGKSNIATKELMITHAFKYVENVYFHIGATNFRSQISIQRIGGEKTREIEVEYYGEQKKMNFEFVIRKEKWKAAP
ncbi:MAG: GNAT family N-acetyltransferase [Saprospiraceae bacterium]